MKKRIVIASIMGLILALAMGSTALASHPRQNHAGGHHHRIILPNGNCVDAPADHKAGNATEVVIHGGC